MSRSATHPAVIPASPSTPTAVAIPTPTPAAPIDHTSLPNLSRPALEESGAYPLAPGATRPLRSLAPRSSTPDRWGFASPHAPRSASRSLPAFSARPAVCAVLRRPHPASRSTFPHRHPHPPSRSALTPKALLTDFACPPKQKLLTAISRERFLSLHPLRCSTAHAPAAGSRRPMHHVPRLAPSSATHRVAFLRSTRRHFPLHVHLHQVALRSPSHREPSDPALPRRLPVPAPAHAPAPSGFRTAPLLLAVPSPLTPLSHFLPHPTNSLPFAPDLAAAPSTSLQLLFRLLPTRSPLPTLPHDPR